MLEIKQKKKPFVLYSIKQNKRTKFDSEFNVSYRYLIKYLTIRGLIGNYENYKS